MSGPRAGSPAPFAEHSIPFHHAESQGGSPTQTSVDEGQGARTGHGERQTSLGDAELPTVDGYDTRAKVGHGGMGVVYKLTKNMPAMQTRTGCVNSYGAGMTPCSTTPSSRVSTTPTPRRWSARRPWRH